MLKYHSGIDFGFEHPLIMRANGDVLKQMKCFKFGTGTPTGGN